MYPQTYTVLSTQAPWSAATLVVSHISLLAAPVRNWAIYFMSQDFIESSLQGRTLQSRLKVEKDLFILCFKVRIRIRLGFSRGGKETQPPGQKLDWAYRDDKTWPWGLAQKWDYSRFGGCFDMWQYIWYIWQWFAASMFAGCKSQMTYQALNASSQFSTTLFISVRATVFGSSPFRYQETDRNRKNTGYQKTNKFHWMFVSLLSTWIIFLCFNYWKKKKTLGYFSIKLT